MEFQRGSRLLEITDYKYNVSAVKTGFHSDGHLLEIVNAVWLKTDSNGIS